VTDSKEDQMPTTYLVRGLTCGHCVGAVTAELDSLPGVQEVRVELVPDGASSVTVISADELDRAAVESALDRAGEYRLLDHGQGPEDS
jgi:copper chaperone CopZ